MKKPEVDAPAGWYDSPEHPDSYQFWNGKYWVDRKILKGEELPDVLPAPTQKSFISSIKHTLANSFKFKGRASRREYWLFQIVYWVPFIYLINVFGESSTLQFIPGIFYIGLYPTQISLFVRRCHDSNRSGGWYFFPIGNLYVLFDDSDSFENRFGKPSF